MYVIAPFVLCSLHTSFSSYAEAIETMLTPNASKTQIGVGKVIRGWDEGVTEMTLGEKTVLTISPDYAYGDRGFPGLIPPNSTLVL